MNAEAAAVTVTLEVEPSQPVGPAGPLPRTGADVSVLVMVALSLILLGALIVFLARTALTVTAAHPRHPTLEA